jgi:uncharacterized protein
MKLISILLIVVTAATGLLTANLLLPKIPISLNANPFISGLAKYQVFALLIAIAATSIILILNPNSKSFLSFGDWNVVAEKEKCLGINGKSSWKINGLQLLVFISIATGAFMFLAVKYTNSLSNFQLYFIPFILLFSFTNALSEELIFRFSILAPLSQQYSKLSLLILSALLFGLPHYFGQPSGIIGVIMASILGYVLCKATYETKGLAIAFTIHFVQDVIIFTALFIMNSKA